MSSLRIRTLTLGIDPAGTDDLPTFERALTTLRILHGVFTDAGYEIQTTRIATTPLATYRDFTTHTDDMEDLLGLDRLATETGILLSVGPIATSWADAQQIADWAAQLIATTTSTSFSIDVSPGAHASESLEAAARAMCAIGQATSGGEGNFRFAAAANIAAGTPFFPVAYHAGPESLSIGLEFPRLLGEAAAGGVDWSGFVASASRLIRRRLGPIAELGQAQAEQTGLAFAGVDLSPAPGLDCSIARVIETLTGAAFGDASTLAACALLTGVLRNTGLPSCGYSGLFLPILEDKVLAQRAAEGRFSVKELLLYSSVCGAGLDLVPLPGNVDPKTLKNLIADVAALATRLAKPLSARLLPLPGYAAGDKVSFENPYLTDAVVMALE